MKSSEELVKDECIKHNKSKTLKLQWKVRNAFNFDTFRLQIIYINSFQWGFSRSVPLSALYYRIWLKGSQFVHTC